MNRIALGTVQFGLPYGIANKSGKVSRTEAKAMLQLAATYGIDVLDTAITYGESETCLGDLGTEEFKVVTKLPSIPEDCSDINEWMKQQMMLSLSRLHITSCYGCLLHQPGQLQGRNGFAIYQALQSLKDNGQVHKVGISIYSPNELEDLIPHYCFDLVQVPFNLVDQRIYRSGWMQRLKEGGVELHTRSVFLQGLLLMAQGEIPSKFNYWLNLWQTWHDWLAKHRISAVQACISFPLSFPEIDRVVVGAENAIQLEQIMSAANDYLLTDFPDLNCIDENLINPAKWSTL